MIRRNSISSKLLVGLAGLGLTAALGACTAGTDSASTTATESPIAEATQSPMADSPMAGSPATGQSSTNTLNQVVADDSSFSTLRAAIQAAGLEATLSGTEPYTIFAPTNEAFAALPAGTLDQLLLPENKAKLQQVLSYHVVPGTVTSADITPGEVTTVEGAPVNVTTNGGEVTVGDAKVTKADITASNGVIHAIDKVLLPPTLQAQ